VKTLNASLVLEKNKLYSKAPWIHLFAIVIDSDTTIYRAAYPEDVTWNGQTYTATPIWIDPEKQTSSGRLADLTVHIANVDQTISAYVENNQLTGNNVTIYIVSASDLSITSDILSSTYRINRIRTTETVASFELGHDDLFALQLPHQRFVRDKCRFVYGPTHRSAGGAADEDYCRYPGDEFDEVTETNFLFGGDGGKGVGWTAVNMANAGIADINIYTDGWLNINPLGGAARDWNNTTRDAPHVYKTFIGDFDAYVRSKVTPNANGGTGFCVQSTTDLDDWFALLGVYSGGSAKFYARNTVSGVSSDTDEGAYANNSDFRIARSGNTLTYYGKSAYEDSWTEHGTVTRADFSATIRLILLTYTVTTTSRQGGFAYLRFYSGGLTSCDYTFDGPNGCRVHENTPNFGGAPGIPSGRLNV
jgi:phage-related protein